MIAVLMSTYNGARYLQAQLDSVLAQSRSDLVLYIRDDGSTDGTQDLIGACRDPRVRFIQGQNLGPAASFFALLREAADADYVFLCDQDDIWYPDKVEKMLDAIAPYGDVPTMLFSDFAMIDSAGEETARSYAEYASLRVAPGNIQVRDILAQPYVFGCASVMNRALVNLVLEPPAGIEMHDCWISLVAACVGNLIYDPMQLIAHRFHSSNATGRERQASFLSRLRRITSGFRGQCENTKLRLQQVKLLLENHGGILLPQAQALLEDLSAAVSRGRISTVSALRKWRVGRQRTINTLFFYMTVLGMKGEIS